jgi:hypothetical protein
VRDLFDQAEAAAEKQRPGIVARFREFDSANPGVWELFERFALQAIATGRRRLSASLITERIRWEIYVATVSDDGFKLNNDFRAFYARKFMKRHPEHPEIFATRSSAADEATS